MNMDDTCCASEPSTGVTMSPNPTRPKTQHRVLLVGVGCFAWLRVLQERAPGPRVDLRYFIEGVIALLEASPELKAPWMDASKQSLINHVSGRTSLQAHGNRTGRHQAADGAQARTQGGPVTGAHHEDCKALQVGEGAFQWLKGVQGTTRDPRLDMRYLVEGALLLLSQKPELLPAALGLARRSLREHLAALETQPIEPFSLEKQS